MNNEKNGGIAEVQFNYTAIPSALDNPVQIGSGMFER